ncbi:MAG TPA: hypothetical protein VFH74_01355 [Gaiellales bacterium]|nr:hypothetical protein [Gaiellales bacterium]
MRLAIGLLCAASMLLVLAAAAGSPAPQARAPAARVLRVRLGGHPHPCTPYAGCNAVQISVPAGSLVP